MIIVTGGAGFIGSNLVRGLNRRGRRDVIVVDDLTDGTKFENIVDCQIVDYMDKDEFQTRILAGQLGVGDVEIIFHQGACTDTTEWNGRLMLENNHACSRSVLKYCQANGVRLAYASSAAVYGVGRRFEESRENECPVNVYGYSKKLFDDMVRQVLPGVAQQVAGLRYFNVYGPGEWHKGRMASVVMHLHGQLRETGVGRLFRGSGGYDDGEQRRDFVHVEDVVDVNLWLLDNPGVSGIFNVGTGTSCTFNDLARALIAAIGNGSIEYVDMPRVLAGSYQHFTEASLDQLRSAGYTGSFRDIEQGIAEYVPALDRHLHRT